MGIAMAGADIRTVADMNVTRGRRAAHAVAIGFARQAARDVSAASTASAPEGTA